MRSIACTIIALLGCKDPRPPATKAQIMTHAQTIATGIRRIFGLDGKPSATYVARRLFLDPSGSVEAEENLTPNGALDYRLTYRRDAKGQLSEEAMTFGDGSQRGRWVHHCDGQGRLLRREFFDAKNALAATETYTFEPDGRTASVVRGRIGQWTNEYDASGNLVRKRGGPASGDEMDQEFVEYEYDAQHRLIRQTERTPSGAVKCELSINYP
jgi:YD repeat-containing protein